MTPLSLLAYRTVSILELKTIVNCINKALHAVKPMQIGHPKIDKIKILMINGSLMKVKSIAECSPWYILQYFGPALSEYWSWKHVLCLFEIGRFTQVLL